MSTAATRSPQTGSGTTLLSLALYPMDVLFFGDARPSAAATRLASRLPVPQTVGGAILATILRTVGWDFEALARELRRGATIRDALRVTAPDERLQRLSLLVVHGPWFARKRPGTPRGYEVLAPIPHDLYWLQTGDKRELIRVTLTPTRQPVICEGINLAYRVLDRTTFRPGKLKAVDGFLTEAGLEQYLKGNVPDQAQIVSPEEVVNWDNRVGIALSPDTLTSERGMIFSRRFLKLSPDVFVYVALEAPEGLQLEEIFEQGCLFPLGGERRYVRCELLAQNWPLASWPGAVRDVVPFGIPAIVLMLTPGIYPNGLPVAFRQFEVAMSCRSYEVVSGWNMALAAPRPSRTAVGAGTVYLLSQLRPLLPNPLVSFPDDSLYGWGCWVAGEPVGEEDKFGSVLRAASTEIRDVRISAPTGH